MNKRDDVDELGVAMLGYAFMGKAHSNAYRKMPFFFYPPPAYPKLVAICGRDRENVYEAAKKYGYGRAYTDWRKAISDHDVDVVDNGLPNYLHKDPTIEAVEKGKHVLCEKPLGLNAKEAEEMLRAATKAGVKHMVGHNYRFIPAIRLAKEMIDSGRIGRILDYRAVYLQDWLVDPAFPINWRLKKETTGTGAIGDLGSHVLDFARMLVGEIDSVSAITKTFTTERPLEEKPNRKGTVDVDDAFIALLKFKGGRIIGSVESSRTCAGMKNYARVEVHGTEGTIRFNLERLNELELYSTRDRDEERGFRTISVTEKSHPYIENWWPPGHILGWEHAMVHEVYHFFNAIENDQKVEPLGATFYDGLRVNKIMDAIVRSGESGRWETTA